MANFALVISALLLFIAITEVIAGRCTRTENAKKSKKLSGDGGYRVFIDGNPESYTPGKIYNGKANQQILSTILRFYQKFLKFIKNSYISSIILKFY